MYVDREGLADPGRHPEHAELGLRLQAVPRFDLEGGHAPRSQLSSPAQGSLEELLVGRRPRRPYGGHDAPTGRGDLLVGGPVEPLSELTGPVAAEDDVRVAIDEAREQPLPTSPVDRPGQLLRLSRELPPGPHPADPVPPCRHRPVLDPAEAVVGHGRQVDPDPDPVPRRCRQ